MLACASADGSTVTVRVLSFNATSNTDIEIVLHTCQGSGFAQVQQLTGILYIVIKLFLFLT
jgi:hypothetical protein